MAAASAQAREAPGGPGSRGGGGGARRRARRAAGRERGRARRARADGTGAWPRPLLRGRASAAVGMAGPGPGPGLERGLGKGGREPAPLLAPGERRAARVLLPPPPPALGRVGGAGQEAARGRDRHQQQQHIPGRWARLLGQPRPPPRGRHVAAGVPGAASRARLRRGGAGGGRGATPGVPAPRGQSWAAGRAQEPPVRFGRSRSAPLCRAERVPNVVAQRWGTASRSRPLVARVLVRGRRPLSLKRSRCSFVCFSQIVGFGSGNCLVGYLFVVVVVEFPWVNLACALFPALQGH